jgi:hypothetical protein
MRYNRDPEFRCHQKYGDDFVHAAQATGVDLANVDCTGREELLEHYPVLTHFAGCDADGVGGEGGADGFVAENYHHNR